MNLFENVMSGKIMMDEVDTLTENDIFTEAVFPDQIPYMKISRRMITLPLGTPQGRGCISYLYANTSDCVRFLNLFCI